MAVILSDQATVILSDQATVILSDQATVILSDQATVILSEAKEPSPNAWLLRFAQDDSTGRPSF